MSDNFVALQKQIREQNQRLQDYISDLNKWEDSIKQKDNDLSKKDTPSRDFPPIRGATEQPKEKETKSTKSQKTTNASSQDSKPIKPKSYTEYSKWDKLDVDKALQEIDENEEQNQQEKRKENKKEKEEKANKIKERGNKEFQAKNFAAALKSYSEALDYNSENPVILSNRSMALIRLGRYSEAEQDASKAISFDENYVKAYNRRATANKHLGKYKEALKDLNILSRLKPGSKQVKKEKEQVHQLIKQQEEKLNKTSTDKKSKPKGKKYTIQEVESESVPQEKLQSKAKLDDKNKPTEKKSKIKESDSKKDSSVAVNTPDLVKNIGSNVKVPDSPPQNGYEFERVLHSLQGGSRKQLYQYLKIISPNQLPELLSVILDSDILILFSSIVKEFFFSDNPEFRDIIHGFGILKALSETNRFDMTLMFLETNELDELKETFEVLEQNLSSTELPHSEIQTVKKKYNL